MQPIQASNANVDTDDIISAFRAANLDIPNLNDTTKSDCRPIAGADPCTKWVHSDYFIISEWPTAAIAAKSTVGPADHKRRLGKTTIEFRSGENIPSYDRAAYLHVLDQLQAESDG